MTSTVKRQDKILMYQNEVHRNDDVMMHHGEIDMCCRMMIRMSV